ncbi:MAG: Sfum_1244 family protein [Pseudomonadota bacterium]
MNTSLQQLCEAVQRNCHISDARQGADYGLCTYLMKMREYFRWEQGLGFDVSLPREEVGDWLTEREALWNSLADKELVHLPLADERFDPFEVDAINAELEPLGLVYSAGYGVKNKPLFFLGHLERREQPGTVSVWVSGRELARDLTAPAAMNQGERIFIRRESFRRLLWEKLESWRWHRPDNALGRAFACYDFENALESSLDAMVEQELNAVLLHEQGEYQVSCEVGDRWNQLLLDLGYTPAELMARAIRDHWADCRVTLPELIRQSDAASIHFYVGGLSGMRKSLFPKLQQAYEQWSESGDWQLLEQVALQGRNHWSGLAHELLDLHEQHGNAAARPIKELVEGRYL